MALAQNTLSPLTAPAGPESSILEAKQLNGAGSADVAALLQLLTSMEQRMTVLEVALRTRPESPGQPPPMQPQADPILQFQMATLKDLCERIETADVPNYYGTEAWIIEFRKLCRLMRLQADKDILLAVGIVLKEIASIWSAQTQKEVVPWQQAREAVLRAYGDLTKHEGNTNNLDTSFPRHFCRLLNSVQSQ